MSYISTIKKRTRLVTRDDFEAASNVTICQRGGNSITLDDMYNWNRSIPFLPQDLSLIVSGKSRHNWAVDLRFSENNNKILFSQRESSFTQEMDAFLCIDPFETSSKIDSCISHLPSEKKGLGFGREWLRQSTEICAAFSYPEFPLFATFENGGYVWARAGVKIDSCFFYPKHYGPVTETDLYTGLATRLSIIRDMLPFDDFSCARKAIESLRTKQNQNAAVEIAQMRRPFSSRIVFRGMIDLAAGYLLHEREYDRGRAFQKGEEIAHDFYASLSGAVSDKRFVQPLGSVLLNGLNFPAVVDFSDDQQMKRVGDYCGGWNTLVQRNTVCPTYRP